MAPSATMLFLSYHQLHGPAPPAEAPWKEGASPSGGGGGWFSVSSVFSPGAFARRREAAPVDQGKTVVGCKRDAVVEEKSPAAAELDEKF
jgi:hypothetical protein